MKVLKLGSKGPDVKKWQNFLLGQGYTPVLVDGDFGEKTRHASILFQQENGLYPDGVVGQQTFLKAMTLGFEVFTDPEDIDKTGPNWPPPPGFNPITANTQRQQLFGKFDYTAVGDDFGSIRILGTWQQENIIPVIIPQLIGVQGASSKGTVYFHKLAAGQLKALFLEWEQLGLLSRILTWEGSFVPRFVRGSTTLLSNHSFGSAFDINYAWNKLGVIPTLVGQRGSVRELVTAANRHGFYWGGHYATRKDGMHFEIAKIV